MDVQSPDRPAAGLVRQTVHAAAAITAPTISRIATSISMMLKLSASRDTKSAAIGAASSMKQRMIQASMWDPSRLNSMRHQGRNGHRLQHFAGDATEHRFPEAGMAVAAHHEEIETLV